MSVVRNNVSVCHENIVVTRDVNSGVTSVCSAAVLFVDYAQIGVRHGLVKSMDGLCYNSGLVRSWEWFTSETFFEYSKGVIV